MWNFKKKKKKWVKWAILAKVWSKIVQVFISGYALKINFKVSSMIEHSKMIKSHLSETSKKSFFPDCVQNFETLYLRSWCNDYFQTLQHDTTQWIKKRHFCENSKKFHICDVQAFILGYALKINLKLCSMIVHSK